VDALWQPQILHGAYFV